MNSSIKVTSFIVCYNQENTILQTLESVCGQIVNFDYEVIIGDDCSTDKTREICEEFIAQNQDKNIKIFPKQKNIGMIENYKRLIAAAQGEYIAGCAGDDYWCDDYKIQKQFDFLEKNPDYGMVHTNYKILRVASGSIQEHKGEYPSGDILENLFHGNFIIPVTAVYKRSLIIDLINEGILNRGFLMEDYPLWFYIAERQKIKHLEDITAVYRKNVESLSYSQNPEKTIAFRLSIIDIQVFFAERNNFLPVIKARILKELKYLLVLSFKNNLNQLVTAIYMKIKSIAKPSKKDSLLFKSNHNTPLRYISLGVLKVRSLF